MYYVYVIKSSKDNYIYTGHTDNLKRRFEEHNDKSKGYQPKKTFRIIIL
jgi:predicted GIY-YIG superfamily endonuclease